MPTNYSRLQESSKIYYHLILSNSVDQSLKASAGGKIGDIIIKPYKAFSLDEQTNELRKTDYLK